MNEILKALLYGQLKGCARCVGRPRLQYIDTFKHNLKICNVNTNNWKAKATNTRMAEPMSRSCRRVSVWSHCRCKREKSRKEIRRSVCVQQVQQTLSVPERPPLTQTLSHAPRCLSDVNSKEEPRLAKQTDWFDVWRPSWPEHTKSAFY